MAHHPPIIFTINTSIIHPHPYLCLSSPPPIILHPLSPITPFFYPPTPFFILPHKPLLLYPSGPPIIPHHHLPLSPVNLNHLLPLPYPPSCYPQSLLIDFSHYHPSPTLIIPINRTIVLHHRLPLFPPSKMYPVARHYPSSSHLTVLHLPLLLFPTIPSHYSLSPRSIITITPLSPWNSSITVNNLKWQ